jgi:hypothetical protein
MAVPKMEPQCFAESVVAAAVTGGSYNEEFKRIKYSLPQNRTQTFSVCAPRRFVTRRRK